MLRSSDHLLSAHQQARADCTELESLVRRHLDRMPGLEIAFAVPADHRQDLLPEELAAVERAVDKRLNEFSTGRVLARRAMASLGLPASAVPKNPGRSPHWPAGCIGSITHADGLVGAAVARAGVLTGLGIDLELSARVGANLYSRLFTDRELAELETTAANAARYATLRFSAKEAVYKAVNPIVDRFFGFQEVEIVDLQAIGEEPAIDQAELPSPGVETGRFRLRYLGDHPPNRIMESGVGWYCFFERYVFTLFMIP